MSNRIDSNREATDYDDGISFESRNQLFCHFFAVAGMSARSDDAEIGEVADRELASDIELFGRLGDLREDGWEFGRF